MTRDGINQEALDCLRGFYEPKIVERIRTFLAASSRTILAAPELIEQVGFARLLVGDTDRRAADPLLSFGSALLIINEIAANSASEPVVANLSGSLRGILRAAGNERMLAYRYMNFREWSRSTAAVSSNNYMNIDSIFEKSSGLSVDDFFAAGFLYAGLAEQMDIDVNREAVMPLFHTDWAKLSDVRPLRQFLRSFSWSRTALREFFKQDSLEVSVRRWFKPLLLRPIVQFDRLDTYIPSRELLKYAMFSAPYFRAFNAVRHDRELRNKASRFFGEFFEQYTRQLLQLATRGNGLELFRPVTYSKKNIETTDSIVWDGERLFFFECVATWASEELIGDYSLEALVSLMERVAFKKVAQLNARIADFRNAKYTLPGIGAHVPIIPIIVHAQTLPRGPLFTLLVKNRLKRISASPDFCDLEFIEIEGLESIVQWLSSDRTNLWRLLSRKRCSLAFRSSSLMEFILETKVAPVADVPGSEVTLSHWETECERRFRSWM